MTCFSRFFEGNDDYGKVKTLIKNIISINGYPFHGSTGDLDFWTTVLGSKSDLYDAKLWFNENKDVIAFAWPNDQDVDVFIHPHHKSIIDQVVTWIEKQRINNNTQEEVSLNFQCFENDLDLKNTLIQKLYNRTESYMTHFKYDIDSAIETLPVPNDYKMKTVRQLEDLNEKIKTYSMCFPSHNITTNKYILMTQTDSYNDNLDLVVIAPNSSVASFATIWVDHDNHIGIFEPLGTHPDYRRKGLSRMVICEGLRRLEELGMSTAFVKTSCKNIAAQSLYKLIGFSKIGKEFVWTKKL